MELQGNLLIQLVTVMMEEVEVEIRSVTMLQESLILLMVRLETDKNSRVPQLQAVVKELEI